MTALVFLCLGLAAAPGGAVAWAGVGGHKPKPVVRIVIQPKWHRLASGGVAVIGASGRYVFIGRWSGSASVVDEPTRHSVRLTPPAGCFFDTESARQSAAGGWWRSAIHRPLG